MCYKLSGSYSSLWALAPVHLAEAHQAKKAPRIGYLLSVLVIASVNVSRGIPAKPNHPHEDIGASFYYLIGRIAPRSA